MKLNWKSVKAVHVTQACEALLNSAGPGAKPRGLVVIYKDKQLPAKLILRMAYCLANNIPSETKLKLRQVDVLVSQGQSMGEAIRQIGVSEVTFYRWRSRLHRARPSELADLRASRLFGARTASFDASQGAAGPRGYRVARSAPPVRH